MLYFDMLFKLLCQSAFQPWLNTLPNQLTQWWEEQDKITQVKYWQQLLEQLPSTPPLSIDLKEGVMLGKANELTHSQQKKIAALLKGMMPWRKGPYSIYGIDIDTEWRSDWKWQRVAPHLDDLSQRSILDVGCGNGYHMWRMLGAGAKLVIGVDPMPLFFFQFHAIQKIYGTVSNIHFIPLPFEQLAPLTLFDTVFSMGVLYHRRSPFEHLLQLKQQLRRGGQLVLETLVIEGTDNSVLVPVGRYAQMRNVYFIPSSDALMLWLKKVGFIDIKLVDINQTSLAEQRQTEWMRTQSLSHFLDPKDNTKTIEGYPAPQRAVITARNI